MKKIGRSLQTRLLAMVILLAGGLTLISILLIWGLLRWEEDFVFKRLLEYQVEYVSTSSDPTASLSPPFIAVDTVGPDSEKYRKLTDGFSAGLYEFDSPESLMILVGVPNADSEIPVVAVRTDDFEFFEEEAKLILYACVLMLLLSFGLALFVGFRLVVRIVGPLNRLAGLLSERKAEELTAPISNEFIEDEIGMVASAYDGLQLRLNAALQREKKFASEASHELRTPLAVALNAVELIKEKGAETVEVDAPAMQRIERSLFRMRVLVEAFLALGRNPPLKVETKVLLLNELVEDALNYHQYAYRMRPLTIERNYVANYKIAGEPELLKILIRNLVINASIHAPGERLSIALSDHSELVFSNRLIDASLLAFSGSRPKPTGIGLAIVSRVAERLNFELAYGVENKRFVVTINIPM